MNGNGIDLKAPIFWVDNTKNFLIVCVGGGKIEYGVKNNIYCFNNNTYEKIDSLETGNDLPECVKALKDSDIFAVITKNKILFYNIDSKKINEIYSVSLDSEPFEDSISRIDIDSAGGNKFDLAASIEGELFTYKVESDKKSITQCNKGGTNRNAHLRSINRIIICSSKKIFLTASGDCSCKLWEIASLKQLAKCSFRVSLSELSNYYMRDIAFNAKDNLVYTIQSPIKGTTYLTKWNLSKNLAPIKTVFIGEICHKSIVYDRKLNTLAIGSSDGSICFVDGSSLQINGVVKASENEINCIKYHNGKVLAGSANGTLKLVKVVRSSFLSFKFVALVILVSLLVASKTFLVDESKK